MPVKTQDFVDMASHEVRPEVVHLLRTRGAMKPQQVFDYLKPRIPWYNVLTFNIEMFSWIVTSKIRVVYTHDGVMHVQASDTKSLVLP
jgi:hypothetical protein